MSSVAIVHRCCSTCFATFRSEFARCPIDGGEIVPFAHDPFLGTTIDHYMIDRCVGEGGMGRVYLAHHVRLEHRRFALKVLFGDLAASQSTRMRFSQEAEAASRLHHENVIEVFDFGRTAGGLLYLVMDFVEGMPLSDLISHRGSLDVECVVALARGMCAGLAHAHACGFVHRDFKPDNVIVSRIDERDVPRIVDFGLALELDAASARLTTTGLALGTPIYAAPEQVQGREVDQRADLFALGVTLYEMLAGRAPFEGDVISVMIANATQDPPPIAARTPGVVVPPKLEALIHRLMAREPSARPASAEEVLAELDAVEHGVEHLEVLEPPTSTHRSRRRPVFVVASTLALIAATVMAVVAVPTHAPTPRRVAPTLAVEPSATRPTSDEPPDLELAEGVPSAPPVHVGMSLPSSPRQRARRPRVTIQPPEVALPAPAEATRATPVFGESGPAPALPTATVTRPPPPEARPPVTNRARVEILGIAVQGPLAVSTITRALRRLRDPLAACYGPVARTAAVPPRVRIIVRVEIDETGRTRSPQVTSAQLRILAGCVSRSLQLVRTDVAPDVGTAIVSFTIEFVAEPSS